MRNTNRRRRGRPEGVVALFLLAREKQPAMFPGFAREDLLINGHRLDRIVILSSLRSGSPQFPVQRYYVPRKRLI